MYTGWLDRSRLLTTCQFIALALDNASNNDTMLDELDVVLPEGSVGGSVTRVRCICHIFNLVVKVCMLSVFSLRSD